MKTLTTYKKIFWALFFLHSLATVAISFGQDQRETASSKQREKLLSLIREERKTLAQGQNKGAELEHRLIELDSEELKIQRQYEDENFIKNNAKNENRNNYFQTSKNMERQIYSKSMEHIKKFPNYKRKGEIFFTIALNNLEYGDGHQTEILLHQSLKNSENSSTVSHQVRVALAEYYFNQKKYPDSVKYYQIVVRNFKDKWLPKHLYNYAWGELKLNRHSSARDLLHQALLQSQKSDMVDNSVQILESVPLFYVLEEKVEEAIEIIKRFSKNPISLLLKLASTAAEKLGEKQAILALKSAREMASSSSKIEDKLMVLDWELDFHQVQKRDADFLKALQTFVAIDRKNKLKKDVRDTTVNKGKLFVGDLQETLAKDVKDDSSVYNSKKLKIILDTFEALTQLSPKEEGDFRFYQGESLFAIKDFDRAFKAYGMGIKAALEKRINPEIAIKLFDSIFSTLDQNEYPKEKKEASLRLSYESYLRIWPVGEKSSSIFQKLISLYLHQNKVKEVERVLFLYSSNYPQELNEQRQFLYSLLDQYISSKQSVILGSWIKKMKQGKFSVPGDKIKEVEIVLGQILFGEYEKMADREKAIDGLEELFHSEIYPDSIKEKASYNLAVEYNKMGKASAMYSWLEKSLPLTPREHFQTKVDSFMAMLLSAVDWGDWDVSKKLSQLLIKREADFKTISQRELLFKLFGIGIINSKKFFDYPLVINAADDLKVNSNIRSEMFISFAKSMEVNEESWYQEKPLLNELPQAVKETLSEISSVRSYVKNKKVGSPLLELNKVDIGKGFSSLMQVEDFLDQQELEFNYEGEMFEVEKFKLALAGLIEKLGKRVEYAESLAQSPHPIFVITGQNLMIESYNKFLKNLEEKQFVFPGEEYREALEKEKLALRTDIKKRVADLKLAQTKIYSRDDLVVLLERPQRVEYELSECDLKKNSDFGRLYHEKKLIFFEKQIICQAEDGYWESVASNLVRFKEVGGKISGPELTLISSLATFYSGNQKDGINNLHKWYSNTLPSSSTNPRFAEKYDSQRDRVYKLLQSYGKVGREENLKRSLSWIQ